MGGVTYKHIVTALLLGISQLVSAQQHPGAEEPEESDAKLWIKDYKPQHGGELVSVGEYKLEVVLNRYDATENISVYVIKKKKEVALADASGEAELNYKDGVKETRKLTAGPERLVMDSLRVAAPANIIFKIKVPKKNITAIYYYPGLK